MTKFQRKYSTNAQHGNFSMRLLNGFVMNSQAILWMLRRKHRSLALRIEEVCLPDAVSTQKKPYKYDGKFRPLQTPQNVECSGTTWEVGSENIIGNPRSTRLNCNRARLKHYVVSVCPKRRKFRETRIILKWEH